MCKRFFIAGPKAKLSVPSIISFCKPHTNFKAKPQSLIAARSQENATELTRMKPRGAHPCFIRAHPWLTELVVDADEVQIQAPRLVFERSPSVSYRGAFSMGFSSPFRTSHQVQSASKRGRVFFIVCRNPIRFKPFRSSIALAMYGRFANMPSMSFEIKRDHNPTQGG
jgi:hypothetical protein